MQIIYAEGVILTLQNRENQEINEHITENKDNNNRTNARQ